jgi:hypothetical protein
MGLSQARITDIGFGDDSCHSDTLNNVIGVIVTGSGNVNTNGLGTARIGDIVVRSDGHIGVIVTGSSSVFSNSIGNARLTDFFTGCFEGIIITGSANVFTGG